jgi:hypothetical protein
MDIPDATLRHLATWSAWTLFEDVFSVSSRHSPSLQQPGVYLIRLDPVSYYVGMAGKRSIRTRLGEYRAGNDLNGFTEIALDAALADAEWIAGQLSEIRAGRPTRARDWARAAIARGGIQACWSGCDGAAHARSLEDAVLRSAVWNDSDSRLLNRGKPRR